MRWPKSEGAQIVCSIGLGIVLALCAAWAVMILATLIFTALYPHDGQNGLGGMMLGIAFFPIALVGSPFLVYAYFRRRRADAD